MSEAASWKAVLVRGASVILLFAVVTDDPSEEINNLIFKIKQDLDELNLKCDSAQQFVDVKKQTSGSKINQLASHNGKVVSQLKTDLMHATKDFKTVLETRASKMKDSQHRKVVLTGNATVSPMRQFSAAAAASQSAQKINYMNGSMNINGNMNGNNGNNLNGNGNKFHALMDGKNDGMSPMPLSSPSPYSNMNNQMDFSADNEGGNNYMQVRY